MALIQRAANNGTWQAAAWWLERRRPGRWALRSSESDKHEEIVVDLVDREGE